MGRKPLNENKMTSAERQRKRREKYKEECKAIRAKRENGLERN